MPEPTAHTPSGLIVPLSATVEAGVPTTQSFQGVKEDAERFTELCKTSGCPIQQGSEMASLLAGTADLWRRWFTRDYGSISEDDLVAALSINRACNLALRLDGHPKVGEVVAQLQNGSVHIGKRAANSRAKDTLWELEVLARLSEGGLPVELAEPDVVWVDQELVTGVACKKVYSEGHVQNILSEAVHQIEGSTGFGLVAINLDELFLEQLPPDGILRVPYLEDALQRLMDFGFAFLQRHEQRYRHYFTKDRLTAAIVGVSCAVRIERLRNGRAEPFYVATQWPCWTHPELSGGHKARVERIIQALQRY